MNTIAGQYIKGYSGNTLSRPALSTTVGAYEIRGANTSTTSDDGFIRISAGGGSSIGIQSYIDLSGYSQVSDMYSSLVFGTSGTERLRIQNGLVTINGPSLLTQYVSIGGTNTENCALYILANTGNTGTGDGIHMKAGPGGDGSTIIAFNNAAGTQRGYINGTSTSITYATSSDSRLKTNVKPIINSIEIIKKLNSVTFDWNGKEKELENDFGFIAQEVHKVIPQTRNILSSYTNCNCKGNYICNNIDHEFPIDKNNKPIYYGLDYSKFTPHLTAAVKELIDQNEKLISFINKKFPNEFKI